MCKGRLRARTAEILAVICEDTYPSYLCALVFISVNSSIAEGSVAVHPLSTALINSFSYGTGNSMDW